MKAREKNKRELVAFAIRLVAAQHGESEANLRKEILGALLLALQAGSPAALELLQTSGGLLLPEDAVVFAVRRLKAEA